MWAVGLIIGAVFAGAYSGMVAGIIVGSRSQLVKRRIHALEAHRANSAARS